MKLLINQLKRISPVVDVTTAWGARVYGTQVCFVMLVGSGQLMPPLSCRLFSTQQGWPARESSCDPWLRYQIWSKDSTSMGMIVQLAKLNGNLFKYDTPQENAFKEKAQQALYHFHARYLKLLLLESTGRNKDSAGEELTWYDHELRPSTQNASSVLELMAWWSPLNTNQPAKERGGMGVGGKEMRSVDPRPVMALR